MATGRYEKKKKGMKREGEGREGARRHTANRAGRAVKRQAASSNGGVVRLSAACGRRAAQRTLCMLRRAALPHARSSRSTLDSEQCRTLRASLCRPSEQDGTADCRSASTVSAEATLRPAPAPMAVAAPTALARAITAGIECSRVKPSTTAAAKLSPQPTVSQGRVRGGGRVMREGGC